MICLETELDLSYFSNVQKYFNMMFINFFKDNKTPLSIIVEINNFFKIEYCSYKLCQILGYTQKNLTGKDLHEIFPIQLREAHKKILLNFKIQIKMED